MPIAKEDLRAWGLVVARKGTRVAQSTVQKFGWHDQVTDDEGIETVELPEAVPPSRGRRRKGA